MKRICLVDDDVDFQKIVQLQLQTWYDISIAHSIADAKKAIEKEKFDLILLDIMLPDGNGLEFCAALRSASNTKDIPIIFLTGRSQPVDKMIGFSIGADDYLVKPFELIETRARIDARIEASQKKLQNGAFGELIQTIGPLKFDCVRQKVYLIEAPKDKDLNFTPFEFKLLYYLALRKGQVFSRVELMKNLFDESVFVCEENIYTHISAVRRKLGTHRKQLESIPRVGYRFIGFTEEAPQT